MQSLRLSCWNINNWYKLDDAEFAESVQKYTFGLVETHTGPDDVIS